MQTQTDSTTAPGKKPKGKPAEEAEANGQTNGHANGAMNGHANGVDPFATNGVQPGDQGIATQDDAPGPDEYKEPEPTQEELKLADDVFRELKDKAHEMGPQAVIDALISIIDVHKQLRTPEIFDGSSSDEDVFYLSDSMAEAARILLRGCPKLEVSPRKVVFYFKNHEKWTSGGQKVHGKVKRFDGFLQHHLDGMQAAVIMNYHFYRARNPRQKVFDLYHLLRQLDAKGQACAPDWVGFFEEPGLFGAGVYEETVSMAQAFQEARAHAGDVHQLSLLAGIYSDSED